MPVDDPGEFVEVGFYWKIGCIVALAAVVIVCIAVIVAMVVVPAHASHTKFTEVTCPLVAPADSVVSCPGWKDRVCRVSNNKRSSGALLEFRKRYGFAKGRPGFVIDHLFPLACGGCDVPWNMTWQTIEDGRAKDRWERDVCRARAHAPDRENEAVWK